MRHLAVTATIAFSLLLSPAMAEMRSGASSTVKVAPETALQLQEGAARSTPQAKRVFAPGTANNTAVTNGTKPRDTSSGLPTGKRTHKPVMNHAENKKPAGLGGQSGSQSISKLGNQQRGLRPQQGQKPGGSSVIVTQGSPLKVEGGASTTGESKVVITGGEPVKVESSPLVVGGSTVVVTESGPLKVEGGSTTVGESKVEVTGGEPVRVESSPLETGGSTVTVTEGSPLKVEGGSATVGESSVVVTGGEPVKVEGSTFVEGSSTVVVTEGGPLKVEGGSTTTGESSVVVTEGEHVKAEDGTQTPPNGEEKKDDKP